MGRAEGLLEKKQQEDGESQSVTAPPADTDVQGNSFGNRAERLLESRANEAQKSNGGFTSWLDPSPRLDTIRAEIGDAEKQVQWFDSLGATKYRLNG